MATSLNINNATQRRRKNWHLHKMNKKKSNEINFKETYKQEIKKMRKKNGKYYEVIVAYEHGKKNNQKSL